MINIKNFIVVLFFSFTICDNEISQLINQIIMGEIQNKDEYNLEELLIKNENNSDIIFLQGLIEKDGKKAADFFEQYYALQSNKKYQEIAIKKLGDYYYAKGSYIQAGKWFELIPKLYPDSNYIESSINYHLNSLLISGNFSDADKALILYEKKFPLLNFNNDKDKSKISEVTYSVLIGNYKSYREALEYKKILSKENFLSRIENISIDDFPYYSLKIGYYKDKQTAKNIIKRLNSRLGFKDAIIISN